jgi:predicted DNA-binding protein
MKDEIIGKILNLKSSWWDKLKELSKEKGTTVTAEIKEAVRKHIKL